LFTPTAAVFIEVVKGRLLREFELAAELTPVQAPHGDQTQFRPGPLKSSEIVISIVWRVAFLEHPCF
jgi:hypothetical protein